MIVRYSVVLTLLLIFSCLTLGFAGENGSSGSPYDLSLSSFNVSFASPPQVTSFTPQTGHTGTPVTLNGQFFFGVTSVKFNGVSASFTFVSDFMITTSVPAGATTGTILVTTPSGSGATPSEFVVDNTPPPAPVLTGTNPLSPSNSTSPQVVGTAEPNAMVQIFGAAGCSGPPLATVMADTGGNFSASVTVSTNVTTTFSAIATDEAGNGSPCSSPLTYKNDSAAPGAPVLAGTMPVSPSNSNAPMVHGTAEPGSTVRIYVLGSCSGPVAGTAVADNAGNFIVSIIVPSNSSTPITATATDSSGNISACSAPLMYVQDNIPPAPPTLTGTSPSSPANNNNPHILGISEPGALVALYTDPSCLSPSVGNGVANNAGLFSIQVTVGDNTTTTFYAHASDSAGNTSGCSANGVTYVEDSNLPPSSICGIKYADLNGNGVYEPGLGETGLSGWQVLAISTLGDTLISTTDATGHYCFGSLTDTLYRVMEAQQSGYIQTGGQPYYVLHMGPTTVIDTVDFGNARPGKIYGTKFNDLNGDGIQQGNEPGLADWTICLSPQQLSPRVHLYHSSTAVSLSIAGGPIQVLTEGLIGTFEGFLDQLTHRIPVTVPQWNDDNDSLPGILIGGKFYHPYLSLNDTGSGRHVSLGAADFVNGNPSSSFFDVFINIDLREVGPGGGCLRFVNQNPVHLAANISQYPYSSGTQFVGGNVILLDSNGLVAGTLESLTLTIGDQVTQANPFCTQTDGAGAFSFLPVLPGRYDLREMQQPCWVQTTPNPSTLAVVSGDSIHGVLFGNEQKTGRICLVKYFDENHNQLVDVDEPPMSGVQFNLLGANPSHAFSGSTDGAGRLCFDNLPPDDYTLTEVVPPGYELSVPKAGFSSFTITGCEDDSVVWMNAAAYTDSTFRTATVEQWALAVDQSGKHKSVKCKPDKVDFIFNLQYRMGVVKLKFPFLTTGEVRIGKNNLTVPPIETWTGLKVVSFDFSGLNIPGQVLEFRGRGAKGKPITVAYQWSAAAGAIIDKGTLPAKPSLPLDSMKLNIPRLPMPNLYNIGEDLERKGVFPIVVGAPSGAHSVIHAKFKDVLKSLVKFSKIGPLFHTDTTSCIGNFLNGSRPILKQQKSLPPDKANSKLFAEVLALKFNIIASQKGQFPVGLDTLIYDNSSGEPGNPLNGKTVREICDQADLILDCVSDPKGLHLLPVDYYSVVHRINAAFASDTVDTASWSCGKLIFKGVRPLKSVPFLFAEPGSIHSVTVPFTPEFYQAPAAFTLSQNYPNPFNPTTTIRFALPEAAIVTLKIYNILGQEVATLLNEQAMDDGVQEVDFDASGMTSGVYFYRVVAQGVGDPDEGTIGKRFTEVKKMLLLK